MVAAGVKVQVHYRGTLDDGREFDNSRRYGAPLEVVLGQDEMLPAFEEALAAMAPGDVCRIRISAEEAYGAYDEALIEQVPAAGFPNAEKLPVGGFVTLRLPDGEAKLKVLKIEDGVIFFDHNHELAGEALNFEIELVDPAAPEDPNAAPLRSGSWGDFAKVMARQ